MNFHSRDRMILAPDMSQAQLATANDPTSSDSYKRALARELLDDIELSRLAPEQLVLKASRLARLVDDDDETRQWLHFELHGYVNTDAGRKLMSRANRWTDEAKREGYWISLGEINSNLLSTRLELAQLRVPDVSFSLSSANPNQFVGGFSAPKPTDAVDRVLLRMSSLTASHVKLSGIVSRAVSRLHDFATTTFHRLAFGSEAESIFRLHQRAIDDLLASAVPDVLEKVPSIVARLAEGDGEAISQAMNSCRRMVKAFADVRQPGEEREVQGDGEAPYNIGSDKVLNRIKHHLAQHCASSSRRERLNKNLRAVWDRASAGTHSDITPAEARALFLQTYLTLGEILDACEPAAA